MDEYNNLLVDLKNAEVKADKQKEDAITNKITSLKKTIGQNCAVIPVTAVIPQPHNHDATPLNQCAELDQWQNKIDYYNKLAGQSDEVIKKENNFSREEINKILSDLNKSYGEIKDKCGVKAGAGGGAGRAVTAPTATSQSSVAVEPVNPVAPISGEEINTYYKAKLGVIINTNANKYGIANSEIGCPQNRSKWSCRKFH